jgi:hypothetical protein
MWLEKGHMMALGQADIVVTKYLAAMTEKDAEYRSHEAPPAEARQVLDLQEVERNIPNIDHRFGDGRGEILGSEVIAPEGHHIAQLQPNTTIVVRISARAKVNLDRPIIGFMFRQPFGRRLRGDQYGTGRARAAAAARRRDLHRRLLHRSPALYSSTFSFSPAIANGSIEQYSICDWIDNALGTSHGTRRGTHLRSIPFPCRVQVNSKLGRRDRLVTEFTGERVIPGEVNDDLWAEHIARYAFASSFAEGRSVLDVGCGAGYGAAELATRARSVTAIDVSSNAIEYASKNYQPTNVHYAQGKRDCRSLFVTRRST